MQWYEVSNVSSIDSPALLIYPERVQHNIRAALQMVDGDTRRLRPHVKTHKCREVADMMIAAGIYQFKCATIAEATMLAQAGAKDVLLAYSPAGPKIERFAQLIKHFPHTQFSCLTDHPDALAAQAGIFKKYGYTVPVYIDIDLGMHRTGIEPGNAALDLYKKIHETEAVSATGIHAYDGHLRNPDFEQKKMDCDKAFEAVDTFAETLRGEGFPVPNIIAGGSPSFSVHAARKQVQCSPGTFIYWDQGYGAICKEQPFIQAAVLVTRVISLPGAQRVTTDLGHKSVASENDMSKRIFFLNADDLQPVSQSEEHLVNQSTAEHHHFPGEVLYGLPYHICPTVALFDSVHVIENHQWVANWKNVARDRIIEDHI